MCPGNFSGDEPARSVDPAGAPDSSVSGDPAAGPPELPTTSYALLGLLSFGRELTGYELQQFSESTLRFYWVAPAMSQVYSELRRLHGHGLVDASDSANGGRRARRYRINDAGLAALRAWLRTSSPEFPILKHPVALRLLLGHLIDPDEVLGMLERYIRDLERRRAELHGVLDAVQGIPEYTYPAQVATWGLAYYDAERDTVSAIADSLEQRRAPGAQPGPAGAQ